MTLVIAGHNMKKPLNYAAAWGVKNTKLQPNGLFIVSDSVITAHGSNGLSPVLGGFRKVYPLSIKIWKPSFLGKYFHSYQTVFFESQCFIAIAGSTLTAQHVLNMISEHLDKLRISYERSPSYGTPGKYFIIRHCQKNILNQGQGINTWDEDMFTDNDYRGIITADAIANIIEYSINEALSSARKYKLDAASLNGMYTEFAAGIHCPATDEHKLYTFRMDSKLNDEGMIEVFSVKNEIPENGLAVLGMRKEFESSAQKILETSIANEIPPAVELFDFLNNAIDTVKDTGNFAIDRPSVLKIFNRGKLTKEKFQR